MSNKLNSNLVWPIAFATAILGVAATYLTANLGTKVAAGACFAVFAIGGFLASFLTQAGKGKAIGAMVVASLITAVGYFVVIKMIVANAADASAAASTASATTKAVASGAMNAVGSVMGVIISIAILADTMVAGIGGALVGAKSKRKALSAG